MKSGTVGSFLRNLGASLQNYQELLILELFFRRKPVDNVRPRSTVDRGSAVESALACLPEHVAQVLQLAAGCHEGRRRERGTWRCWGCPHRRWGGGEAVGRRRQSSCDEGAWWG
jgi:hypothetical protein